MTNVQRLADAFAWAEEFLRRKSGSRKPPIRQARLLVLLSLLHRKSMPAWTRAKIAEFTGHARPDGVDKSLQSLIENGFVTQRIRTVPGRSARGPSIRRERYYEPQPLLFAAICSNVAWG